MSPSCLWHFLFLTHTFPTFFCVCVGCLQKKENKRNRVIAWLVSPKRSCGIKGTLQLSLHTRTCAAQSGDLGTKCISEVAQLLSAVALSSPQMNICQPLRPGSPAIFGRLAGREVVRERHLVRNSLLRRTWVTLAVDAFWVASFFIRTVFLFLFSFDWG